jgi:hypothetical protein
MEMIHMIWRLSIVALVVASFGLVVGQARPAQTTPGRLNPVIRLLEQ